MCRKATGWTWSTTNQSLERCVAKTVAYDARGLNGKGYSHYDPSHLLCPCPSLLPKFVVFRSFNCQDFAIFFRMPLHTVVFHRWLKMTLSRLCLTLWFYFMIPILWISECSRLIHYERISGKWRGSFFHKQVFSQQDLQFCSAHHEFSPPENSKNFLKSSSTYGNFLMTNDHWRHKYCERAHLGDFWADFLSITFVYLP